MHRTAFISRALAVATVVGASVLATAAHALSLSIFTPTPGQDFAFGEEIAIFVSGQDAITGWTAAQLFVNNVQVQSHTISGNTCCFTHTFFYTPTISQAGTTINITVSAQAVLEGNRNAATSADIGAADSTAPTWPGGVGVISAERNAAFGAFVTWNAASDNSTAAQDIVYNVYVNAIEGNVFVGAPAATFTGVTSAQIGGLAVDTAYFVGVRAEDEFGNEDANAVTTLAGLPLSAGDIWVMYE